MSYIFSSVTDQVLTTPEQFLPFYLANLAIKQVFGFSINLHLIRTAVVFPVSVDMCFEVADIQVSVVEGVVSPHFSHVFSSVTELKKSLR